MPQKETLDFEPNDFSHLISMEVHNPKTHLNGETNKYLKNRIILKTLFCGHAPNISAIINP